MQNKPYDFIDTNLKHMIFCMHLIKITDLENIITQNKVVGKCQLLTIHLTNHTT